MPSNASPSRWSGPLLANTRPGELAEAFQPSLLSGLTTPSFKLHFAPFLTKRAFAADGTKAAWKHDSNQDLPLGYHFLYQTKRVNMRGSQQCSSKAYTNCNDDPSAAKLCSPGNIKRSSCRQGKTIITLCHVLQHAPSNRRLNFTLGLFDYQSRTVRGLPDMRYGARFPQVFVWDFRSVHSPLTACGLSRAGKLRRSIVIASKTAIGSTSFVQHYDGTQAFNWKKLRCHLWLVYKESATFTFWNILTDLPPS